MIDVSDPAKPQKLSEYRPSEPSQPYIVSLDISGPRLFLGIYNFGLQIFDISTPNQPFLLGQFLFQGIFSGVTVSGDYAYVLSTGGIKAVNIKNPSQPFLVAERQGFAANACVVRGDKLYVAADRDGLLIFQGLIPPTNPLLSFGLSSQEQHGFRMRIKGILGMPLEIERSTDLINWEPWLQPIMQDYQIELLDLSAISKQRQFYRMRAK